MKKIILLMTLSLMSLAALAKDVIPQNGLTQGSSYVRVTKLETGRIRFEQCIAGYEASTCEYLGNKKYYSLTELRSQLTDENCQILGSVLADAGLAIGTIFGATYVAGTIGYAAYGTATAGTTGMIIGASGGAGIAGTAIAIVDALNPHEQYKQAQTLSVEVVTDRLVKVDNIELFIGRLDTVLSKI